MSLIGQPIKISRAAELLGVSASSIYKRMAGTETLRLFKRGNLWFTWLEDVNRILKQDEQFKKDY